MDVMRDRFKKWTKRLTKTDIHRNQVAHTVWTVPALLCPMLHMSHDICLKKVDHKMND